MFVVEAKGLVKKFGSIVAVNNLDLKIKNRTFYGIVGPNGSGKTTAVRILTGQIKADYGTAKVCNIDVKNYLEVRKLVGIVPEEEYPPSFLTTEEYLEFVCRVRNVKNFEEKINFWLDFLDFKNFRNYLIKDLSRGTKQKIMLAQAFIHEPKVVFLDEPFINIDPIVQNNFKKFLRNYVKNGNTIVFCTHILSLAKEVCDLIGIMKNGRIVKESKG
ncbi:MAG: ABC transporter ATP-binding protein, partial [Candidatus Aenigmarchaeota archaeon]|nr:ABC transporter ATP-binding protein [Candidatus Aenigmarchaeota archaeon]MDW8149024.1 ABC transporter ATP-binding protein [Candidatus Aenigmarchaeota archaeon]